MQLKKEFIDKVIHLNGEKVRLTIVQITKDNHPMGQIGIMMMGEEQANRINNADKQYNGKNGIEEMEATMELIEVDGGYHIIFVTNSFDCNCIEIFRPDPPMTIGGVDMSLWWSSHPLTQHELDKTKVIKTKFQASSSLTEAACHPIREIMINGIRHCV